MRSTRGRSQRMTSVRWSRRQCPHRSGRSPTRSASADRRRRGGIDRALETTPEPVLLAVLHRRIVELLELGDRIDGGASLPDAARSMGITSEFRAKTLAAQARKWSADELTARYRASSSSTRWSRAYGLETDPAQRRLRSCSGSGDSPARGDRRQDRSRRAIARLTRARHRPAHRRPGVDIEPTAGQVDPRADAA